MKLRRHKPRLYVALYARPKHPESYHQAIVVGPKNATSSTDACLKFHVKNTVQIQNNQAVQPWIFEATTIPSVANDVRLLVLVCIGKVEGSGDQLRDLLSRVPVYQNDDVDSSKADSFSCSTWVEQAVGELRKSSLASHVVDWSISQARAFKFVENLKSEGRWDVGWEGDTKPPILDLVS